MAKPNRSAKRAGLKSRAQKFFYRAALAGLGLFIVYEAATWPEVSSLKKKNPKTTAFIELYKERQQKAHKKPYVAWQWKSYSKISPNLKLAVLVSEDLNFFHHWGFDFAEVYDALKEAWQEKEKPRGASTISQQVVKNLWLSPSRNPWRKFKEAILTIQLERELSKKRILEIYLNTAEFGPGIYGAEAAARYYFKKSADELTESEAALLAASLPKPSKWHPGAKYRYYATRTEYIERRMQEAEFLNRWI